MNRRPTTGVWLNEAVMDALAASFPDSAVSRDESLEREFEQRLADCPKLAYRVALGVLHNTAEAEDVAQEAMLRAYRNFHRLRDRERFRGWLVRAAFRLSLDRIRSRSRRERHERAAFEEQREASVENLVASREFERQVARASHADDGRYQVDLRVDRSSLYVAAHENGNIVGKEWSSGEAPPGNAPTVRQYRGGVGVFVREGQPTDATVATDPLTGHILKVEVTLNVVK